MKKLLVSYISELIVSDKRLAKNRKKTEAKRKKAKQPHTLTVYLAIDDPASYLLLQVMPELKQRYDLKLVFKTVLHKQEDMYPEPEMWDKNILADSHRMAQLYQLKSPNSFPLTSTQTRQISLRLIQLENHADFLTQALDIFEAVWQTNESKIKQLLEGKVEHNNEQYEKQLYANESELHRNGHYLSSTLYYGGEWYWGLERLHHLEQRLNKLIASAPQVNKYDKLNYLNQPITSTLENQKSPITIYFSIRSPYSYLGLLKAIKLAEHYNIPLRLKPVLPMLMRGMQVPKNKSLYIALDTKREAQSFNIEFGKIADPLGKGVERCYALFDYAKSQGKEIEFMKNYATAVWSQRVFSDTDKGLKSIIEKTGLNWQRAQGLLDNQDWRNWAQSNLEALFSLGLWGVPSFHYQNTSVFGQDKLRFIEQAIKNNLQDPTNSSAN